MSLKGTAMTNKVLRGKIKDIHQIEEVEALFAEAEELIERASVVLANAETNRSRIAYIDLLAANWEGNASLYSQVVEIDGVAENSKIDINPSVEQLAIFHAKDIAFVAENEDGVVTVYAIGDKPTRDYTIEVCITEVVV